MPPAARLYVAVAVGSSVGAVARYAVWLLSAELLPSGMPSGIPWGTLAVNVAGSLAIGFYATLSGPDGRLLARPATRLFVMAGLLGGLTTFSVFSLETVLLAADGRAGLAAGYVAISMTLWIPAAWIGHVVARHTNRLR